MKITEHQINSAKIAEVISNDIIIANSDDGLDLLGNLYYQGFDKIIIHKKNIVPEFFDLKNGMAGEILQKFSNYRVRLVIVGDFSEYNGKSLRDFIRETQISGVIELKFVSRTIPMKSEGIIARSSAAE